MHLSAVLLRRSEGIYQRKHDQNRSNGFLSLSRKYLHTVVIILKDDIGSYSCACEYGVCLCIDTMSNALFTMLRIEVIHFK